MPASREEEERESRLVACAAAAALASGLVLVVLSMLAMQSGAIFVVDRLVVFEAAWHGGLQAPPLVVTTRRIFQALIFVGFLVVFSALVGIIGARTRHKHLVCTYVVLAAALAAAMVLGGVAAFQRKAAVEPLIARQVVDLCNSTRYMRLAAHIPCDFARAYAPSEVTRCGVYCRWRVGLLRQLQGCEVMPRLCERFYYEALDSEDCAADISEGSSSLYMAVESSERCRRLCDRDIRCTAYAYSGASPAKPERCFLGQAVAAAHPPPRWSPLSPSQAAEYLAGGSSVACYRRTEPRVLKHFTMHGTRLAACTLVLGVVLALSAFASCCLMYNVNVKRQGKPTAAELWLMMCCPCCAARTHRRFNEPALSDGSEADEDGSSELDSNRSG